MCGHWSIPHTPMLSTHTGSTNWTQSVISYFSVVVTKKKYHDQKDLEKSLFFDLQPQIDKVLHSKEYRSAGGGITFHTQETDSKNRKGHSKGSRLTMVTCFLQQNSSSQRFCTLSRQHHQPGPGVQIHKQGGLNTNGSPRLTEANAWSPQSGTI